MPPGQRVAVFARQVAACPTAAAPYPSEALSLDITGAPKVLYKKDGPVAYVVINRPQSLNSCDFETYDMIRDSFRAFDADPALRVAILTGAGDRAFCAGSDIKNNFRKSLGADGEPMKDSDHLPEINKCSKPVICAINGHCNGGGLEQALESDIRVCVRTAQFGLGEARLGVLPGHGGTQRLPRLLPRGRALEMLWTGNRIGADEALRLGLVDHVVNSLADLLPKCEAIAEQICLSAPLAVQAIKKVSLEGLDIPLKEGIRLEAEAQQKLFRTKDMKEGAAAFAAKRPPQWKGE